MTDKTYRQFAKYLQQQNMECVDAEKPHSDGDTHYRWRNPDTGDEVSVPDLGDGELENELILRACTALGIPPPY